MYLIARDCHVQGVSGVYTSSDNNFRSKYIKESIVLYLLTKITVFQYNAPLVIDESRAKQKRSGIKL